MIKRIEKSVSIYVLSAANKNELEKEEEMLGQSCFLLGGI